MKTQKFKRTLSLFLAMLMCVTTLFGTGTTAFAAEETDEGNIPFHNDPCNGVV